jgi:hypothetical protein
VYANSIRALLGVNWNASIRKYLDPENEDHLEHINTTFAPVALGLRKIWAFVESKESKLRVLSANAAGQEEQEVSYPVSALYIL